MAKKRKPIDSKVKRVLKEAVGSFLEDEDVEKAIEEMRKRGLKELDIAEILKGAFMKGLVDIVFPDRN